MSEIPERFSEDWKYWPSSDLECTGYNWNYVHVMVKVVKGY